MQKRFIKESLKTGKGYMELRQNMRQNIVYYTGMLYLILPIPADEHAVEGKTITKIRTYPFINKNGNMVGPPDVVAISEA